MWIRLIKESLEHAATTVLYNLKHPSLLHNLHMHQMKFTRMYKITYCPHFNWDIYIYILSFIWTKGNFSTYCLLYTLFLPWSLHITITQSLVQFRLSHHMQTSTTCQNLTDPPDYFSASPLSSTVVMDA